MTLTTKTKLNPLFLSDEAELALVATCLADPHAWAEASFVDPGQFSSNAYRSVWRVFCERAGQCSLDLVAADLAKVRSGLDGTSALDRLGGRNGLTTLLVAARRPQAARELAELVAEAHANRELAKVCREAERLLEPAEQPLSAAERIDSLQRSLSQIAVGPSGGGNGLRTGLAAFEAELAFVRQNPGKLRGLHTGWRDLDRLLGGIRPGELVVVASNAHEGKSIFATQLATYLATATQDNEQTVPTCLFGLEMTDEQIVARLIFNRARVDNNKFRHGELTEEEYGRVEEARVFIHERLLQGDRLVYKDPATVLTLNQIVHTATYQVRQEGTKALVVDYAQRVTSRYREKRDQEVAEIAKRLKNLALELRVPIVALSQVTRETAKDRSGRPTLFSMAESAALEREADTVIGLWRPARHLPERKEVLAYWQNIMVVDVLKGRQCGTGTCYLRFDGASYRLDDLDHNTLALLHSPKAQEALKVRFSKKGNDD